MSSQTARYLRVMFTPQNPDKSPADVAPSIDALSTRARHLAEVLSNLVFPEDNSRDIPIPVLAQRMKVSDRTVQRAVDELADAGVITVDRGGGGHESPNRYRFPLSPPAHVVPSGDTGDTSGISPAVTPVTASGDTGVTHKIPQEPVVTDTYAVQRGAEPWRQIIERAIAAEDARRAGGT